METAIIAKCLTGDGAAWRDLYSLYRPSLLGSIHKQLGAKASNADLAEEIAARVWYSLVCRDYQRLRAYERGRAGFKTYLTALARQQVQLYYRERQRQCRREVPLADSDHDRRGCADWPAAATQEEFIATLSPREKQYFEQHLLGNATATESVPLSSANRWKLRQRVFDKLKVFLEMA